jgi:hypothetical protein
MAGRPTKYESKFCKQAEQLCLLGATDKNLSDFFEVSEDTINTWKKKYPQFSVSIRRGKILPDAKVAQALYKRAIGYSHKSVKIFNADGKPLIVPYTEKFPPDVTAALKWLYNRQPELWRDKQYMGMEFESLTTEQLNDMVQRLADKVTNNQKTLNNEL